MIAHATATIDAPRDKVWAALVDPVAMTRYLPVSDVRSSWSEGASISWRGELGAKVIDVAGVISRFEPGRALAYRYVDSLFRHERHVTIELSDAGSGTLVAVTEAGQRNERERAHQDGAWRLVLANLRSLLEGGRAPEPK